MQEVLYMGVRNIIKDTTRRQEKYYTVKEVSTLLKLHEETIRRAIRAGRLESIKFGKDYRIKHEDFIRFLEQKKFRVEVKPSQIKARKGSIEALKEVFNTWAGDDAEEIADLIISTRTAAEF
jgi:excisionase family DNA binding protein